MITLEPLSAEGYATFAQECPKRYAVEKVRAGNWPLEGSLERAHGEFLKLLPNGIATQNQHFFSIVETAGGSKKPVGLVWLSAGDQQGNNTSGYVYELYVEESHRRKGYATQTMLALEEKAKQLGLRSLSLHVFGHNDTAIGLYNKVGYRPTNITMTKALQ